MPQYYVNKRHNHTPEDTLKLRKRRLKQLDIPKKVRWRVETTLFRQCIEPESNKINLFNPTRWKRMEMDEMSMSEKNGEEEEEEEQENNSDPDEDGISDNE
jgi:hypothetical protein